MYYKKIKELDVSDITKMTNAELKNVIQTGKEVLTERLEQFERTKISSPAFYKFDPKALRTSGRKSTLQAQAKLVVEKLNDQTITRAGYREWKRNVKEAMGLTGKRISEQKMKDIWEAFDKFKENNPNLEFVLKSPDTVKMTSELKYDTVDNMIEQLEQYNKKLVDDKYGYELSDDEYAKIMGKKKKDDNTQQ